MFSSDSSEVDMEDVKTLNKKRELPDDKKEDTQPNHELDFNDDSDGSMVSVLETYKVKDNKEPITVMEKIYKRILGGIINTLNNVKDGRRRRFVLTKTDLGRIIKLMTGAKHVLIYMNPDITCWGPASKWLVVEDIICETNDGHNLNFKYGFPHWYGFLRKCYIDTDYVRREK